MTRLGPNLTVVAGPDATRAEWLAARQQGIGGSDVAAILGLGKFGKTPLSVWLDKRSPDVVDEAADAEAAEWGNRLEPLLAEVFAERHDDHDISYESPGLVCRTDAPWMLATPDRLLLTPTPALGIWEGKTASLRAAGEWDDDRLPDAYALQVLWYLEVTGAEVAHVSALIGGQRYVERVLHPRPELRLTERLGEWWQRHIVDGEMPDPDPQHDGPRLGSLWHDLDTEAVDLTELADTVSDLRSVRASIDHLEQQEAALVSAIKVAMADRTEALVDGQVVATWRASKGRKTFDAKGLAADHPDIVAAYTRTGSPVRTFLLKEAKA